MGGPYSQLTLGMNLKGFAASVNMRPGEALFAQDMLERDDGSMFKHWSWPRKNFTALAHRPIAIEGLSYKGKNNGTAANPGRSGNFGVADDGPIFTIRAGLYSSFIVLTEGECRYWDPSTQTLAGPVSLPGGVSIAPDPKPTIIQHNNNAYIVGWTDANLRYDPCDRALYEWGWENEPTLNGGNITVVAGGSLVPNAEYKYRASWVNLYTGEESGLGPIISRSTTAANQSVQFAAGAFPVYAGNRHFTDGANLTNNDVGIVVYRTGADGEAYYFLDLIFPGLAAATLLDDGLATDFSLKADPLTYQDPPLLNQFSEAHDMWYGVSWAQSTARFYFNDFRAENSFWERWDPRDHRELKLDEGEVLIAMATAGRRQVALSNLDAQEVRATPSSTGTISHQVQGLDWGVGCVGPKAQKYIDGHLYFLSDRGPYRWLPGAPKPEWIGRPVSPLFIDSTTGLCQLNESLRLESEIEYDQDGRQVRWIFACGASSILNRHLMYWIDADRYNKDPESAWKFFSGEAQCLGNTQALGPLVGGLPITAFDKRARFVFADNAGYVYECDPSSPVIRAGLPATATAKGTVNSTGTTTTQVSTYEWLFTTGDGLAGMRFEVEFTDGTREARTILSNISQRVYLDSPLTQTPADGDRFWIAGIPAIWRSWVDHEGDPKSHKTLYHLYVGFNKEFAYPVPVSGVDEQGIDVSIACSGDWPMVLSRSRFTTLDKHREKFLASLTGRFFTYEFANTRPDEPMLISYFETEMRKLGGIRRG